MNHYYNNSKIIKEKIKNLKKIKKLIKLKGIKNLLIYFKRLND